MIVWLVACTSGGGGGPIEPLDTDTATEAGSTPLPGAELVVTDGNVHSWSSEWRFPEIQIRPEIEIFVDWAGIVTDAHGVARTADSFDRAVLFEVPGSVADLVADLADDTLAPTARWEAPIAGKTEIGLAELGGFDPETALVPDAGRTWWLALCDEDEARLDVRDGIALAPTTGQAGTFVSIPNGGAAFEWLAQIDGSVLRTAEGYDSYPVDWSAVTTDGYGRPFSAAQGDELFVGRFDAVDEADDLGSKLLELEATAAGWWTADVGGRTQAELGELGGTDGAFPGFEAEVVYLIGVRCTTCLGPAPLWVAGVDVRGR